MILRAVCDGHRGLMVPELTDKAKCMLNHMVSCHQKVVPMINQIWGVMVAKRKQWASCKGRCRKFNSCTWYDPCTGFRCSGVQTLQDPLHSPCQRRLDKKVLVRCSICCVVTGVCFCLCLYFLGLNRTCSHKFLSVGLGFTQRPQYHRTMRVPTGVRACVVSFGGICN